MNKITFHGSLAKKWGKQHSFSAPTVFQTMQGLAAVLGDSFKQHIVDGTWHVIVGKVDRKKSNAIGTEDLHAPLTDNEINIFPKVKGRSGVVRVIVGVALIVVGVMFGQPWLVKLGAMVALSGLADMLAKKPSPNNGSQNYSFSGGTNSDKEGVPVPLVYGRVQRAGSVVISQGVDVAQIQ